MNIRANVRGESEECYRNFHADCGGCDCLCHGGHKPRITRLEHSGAWIVNYPRGNWTVCDNFRAACVAASKRATYRTARSIML